MYIRFRRIIKPLCQNRGNNIDCRNIFDYVKMMRFEKPYKANALAVSIDPELYQKVIEERIQVQDTNFSRYIRELIRKDLQKCGLLRVTRL